jgi:hypothetical protein
MLPLLRALFFVALLLCLAAQRFFGLDAGFAVFMALLCIWVLALLHGFRRPAT